MKKNIFARICECFVCIIWKINIKTAWLEIILYYWKNIERVYGYLNNNCLFGNLRKKKLERRMIWYSICFGTRYLQLFVWSFGKLRFNIVLNLLLYIQKTCCLNVKEVLFVYREPIIGSKDLTMLISDVLNRHQLWKVF